MVNVFGNSVASKHLQVVKKVVTTVGEFKDYIDEIQQSYELVEGTFVTPVRVYSGRLATDVLQRIQ